MKRSIHSIHKEIVTARGVPWAKAATGGKEMRTNGRARESITETNLLLFAPYSFAIPRHPYDFHFHPIFVQKWKKERKKKKNVTREKIKFSKKRNTTLHLIRVIQKSRKTTDGLSQKLWSIVPRAQKRRFERRAQSQSTRLTIDTIVGH